jgi:hypothetical protein
MCVCVCVCVCVRAHGWVYAFTCVRVGVSKSARAFYCARVALVIQDAMRRHIVNSGLSDSIIFFHIMSYIFM